MPKLHPDKDWCDHSNFEFTWEAEWTNVKQTSYGNYGGASNTEFYSYTQYANYGNGNKNYQAGYSAGSNQQYYPSLDNTGNQYYGVGNEGKIIF